MKKGLVTTVTACGLLIGLTPAAKATPLIEGSMQTSGSGLLSSCKLATCAPFFAAGCPDDMVEPDGVTTSIVDVSAFGRRALTFSWSAASDATLDGKVFFYVVTSCTAPVGATFAITRAEHSKTWTLPQDAKWVVVETDIAQGATWSAS